MEGSFSVEKEWKKEGIWNKLDALSILLMRFYWVMFIVSIVISISGGMFIGNAIASGKVVTK